jgi:dihydrofolate synthase/folylpolyglutamate synthase
LDSTNVITPRVCAITTIGFDHQSLLGDSIAEIAAEKAGIIKPLTPVVIGRLPADAESVIVKVAGERGAPVVRAQDFAARLEGVTPRLRGAHQRDNALVAMAVTDVLGTRGFRVDADAARFGIEHVEWPGRLEHRQYDGSEVILDAAHNPEGAQALAAYIRENAWGDVTLVFGAMADKDITGMLKALLPVVKEVIFTTAAARRAAAAESLAAMARAIAEPGAPGFTIEPEPRAALNRACRSSRRVVVAGSMFLIGPLRGILR